MDDGMTCPTRRFQIDLRHQKGSRSGGQLTAVTKGLAVVPRPYPPEFRARAIALVRACKRAKQTAVELGIHPVTLSKWLRQDDIDQGRQLAGLKKAHLAAPMEMSPASVTAWESGAKHPNRATVAKLALALKVEPQFFAGSALPGSTSRTSGRSDPHPRSRRMRPRRTGDSWLK
jgi:transposase-like protein